MRILKPKHLSLLLKNNLSKMDYQEVEGQRSGSILYKVDDGHYYVRHMGGSDKPSTWLR